MSGIRITTVKSEIALHDNSFGSSVDGEYMSLLRDDGSYGSGEESSHLVSHSYLETGDHNDPISLRDKSNGVTYKLVPMTTTEEPVPNMQSSPSHDTFYVSIANPVEVYATTAPTAKKPLRPREAVNQQAKAVSTAKKRDDKRRATHNEVERRRRDKINTWIMKLAALVPNSGMPDSASKGGILAKACDHITDLNEKQKRLEKLEVENEKLVLEVLRLNQELTDLRKDNSIVFNHRKDQKS